MRWVLILFLIFEIFNFSDVCPYNGVRISNHDLISMLILSEKDRIKSESKISSKDDFDKFIFDNPNCCMVLRDGGPFISGLIYRILGFPRIDVVTSYQPKREYDDSAYYVRHTIVSRCGEFLKNWGIGVQSPEDDPSLRAKAIASRSSGS